MTIPKRQLLIDRIMETKYADDSDQYHDSNIAFLQSLSVAELEAMSDEAFDDDDLDLDDEGNCEYCGQKCFEGEMCDEQQAGGFGEKCPVCGSTDTCNDPDYPETMKNCNNCGTEWNTDGDITLNGREL